MLQLNKILLKRGFTLTPSRGRGMLNNSFFVSLHISYSHCRILALAAQKLSGLQGSARESILVYVASFGDQTPAPYVIAHDKDIDI